MEVGGLAATLTMCLGLPDSILITELHLARAPAVVCQAGAQFKFTALSFLGSSIHFEYGTTKIPCKFPFLYNSGENPSWYALRVYHDNKSGGNWGCGLRACRTCDTVSRPALSDTIPSDQIAYNITLIDTYVSCYRISTITFVCPQFPIPCAFTSLRKLD